MAKEILLYSPIFSFTAERLIEDLESFKDEDITLRVNSPGGSVFSSWGIFQKMREATNKIDLKIDGLAASASAFLPIYANSTQALDVSRFMLHRADMFLDENDVEGRKLLAEMNKDLRKQLEQRIDTAKFEEITGKSIDDLFNSETRVDVWLSASEAKQIGLINKVVKLNGSKSEPSSISKDWERVYASLNRPEANQKPKKEPKEFPTNKHNNMTLEKLKSEHPEVYAQIMKNGAEQERDRVGAWMAYVDVDPEAVKNGIENGDQITQKTMAELNRKQFSAESLGKLEKETGEEVKTGKPKEPEAEKKEKSEKEKGLETFQEGVFAELGIDKNDK